MSEIEMITGNACLDFVHRDIALAGRALMHYNSRNGQLSVRTEKNETFATNYRQAKNLSPMAKYYKFSHDRTKRVIGYVKEKLDDGGYDVVIMGTETINFRTMGKRSSIRQIAITSQQEYTQDLNPLSPTRLSFFPDTDKWEPTQYPRRSFVSSDRWSGYSFSILNGSTEVSFDDTLDMGRFDENDISTIQNEHEQIKLNATGGASEYLITLRNDEQSIEFGYDITIIPDEYEGLFLDVFQVDNPLYGMFGDVYHFGATYESIFRTMFKNSYVGPSEFAEVEFSNYRECHTCNGVCVPFNLLLTYDIRAAKRYVTDGVVPSDAFLFPLDWENLPGFSIDDDDPNSDDNNDPDDNSRDITPNLPVVPSFLPQQLSNNNYYWLTAPQLNAFMSWYWNDVGDISDIDDLLAKIEGLYNNLSQAIINIRFMPVEYSWICNLPDGVSIPQDNIKIAQIEKEGDVDIISKNGKPIVRDVAHIHIPTRYDSFLDLSPYSQLSLYLPYHGFIDLDINIFMGHDIYVKAIYDFLSGTIQYLIYYDNAFLVTSIVCKMAMDIPISLQTKNDRDSAIFQNVSNVIGGLMGAGLTLGTGNPMGLLVGANALTSGISSAPLNVKGSVGEQGAFYAPPQCAIILRRPTISKPSNAIWKSKVGEMCGKSYTLKNISGFTTVYNPQITFNGNSYTENNVTTVMKPLEAEVQEIYSLLEKGVIL